MRVSRLVRICCGWRLVSDAETTTAVSQQTVGHVNRCHMKSLWGVNVFVCVCVFVDMCTYVCSCARILFQWVGKKFTSLV